LGQKRTAHSLAKASASVIGNNLAHMTNIESGFPVSYFILF
jgi:hypothetical protein